MSGRRHAPGRSHPDNWRFGRSRLYQQPAAVGGLEAAVVIRLRGGPAGTSPDLRQK